MLPISVAHSGRRHDGPSPATRHGGALEHHVHPRSANADRLAESATVFFSNRFALAGERGFGDGRSEAT